jgi:hypothetical protein
VPFVVVVDCAATGVQLDSVDGTPVPYTQSVLGAEATGFGTIQVQLETPVAEEAAKVLS